jgi:hypothetical protein
MNETYMFEDSEFENFNADGVSLDTLNSQLSALEDSSVTNDQKRRDWEKVYKMLNGRVMKWLRRGGNPKYRNEGKKNKKNSYNTAFDERKIAHARMVSYRTKVNSLATKIKAKQSEIANFGKEEDIEAKVTSNQMQIGRGNIKGQDAGQDIVGQDIVSSSDEPKGMNKLYLYGGIGVVALIIGFIVIKKINKN